jgi:hydroxymethylbilane synthase
MKTLKIICRSSRLSLAQAAIVRQKILDRNNHIHVEIITKDTAGDIDQTTPLYEMEGRDFFTKEIDAYLLSGEADISVHSLKDLSAERISSANFSTAIVERIDPRDVFILSKTGLAKLADNEEIVVGTSSLRRQELAPSFLQKAIPYLNNRKALLSCKPIRGNVDSRLSQLQSGKFDALILAAAGLNRLLQSENDKQYTQSLLANTKMMWLPLVECSPAPGQGALLAESLSSNTDAVSVLQSIHDSDLSDLLSVERNSIANFGGGCHQKYGAVSIDYKGLRFTAIAGKDDQEREVTDLQFETTFNLDGRKLFSTTDFMSEFFSYEFSNKPITIEQDTVFVAHHRAVTDDLVEVLKGKRVWCSGTKTWLELAQKGIWCEGCADGLGFSFLNDVFNTPLVAIPKENIHVLTNAQSEGQWKSEGIKASSTYKLVADMSQAVIDEIKNADVLFWTNYQQYEVAQNFLKKDVIHICPAGRTADLFLQSGINPLIFPNIKTFSAWRKKNIG